MDNQEIIAERDRKQHLTLLKAILPYLPQPVAKEQLAEPDVGRVKGEYWEGSVLFGDLSGFTALSETLSALGKESAEEITRIVNDLFEALLTDVEQYGGILVKFGGDAITVYFGGPEHAWRAARAGLALQETMGQRFVNLDTRGGVFTLRLRVGVHTGKIFAAQVGYEPGYPLRGMELVVTGADINRVAEAQDHAAPGEVCITAETLVPIVTQAEVEPLAEGMHRLERLQDAQAIDAPISEASEWTVLEEAPLPLLRLYLQALRPFLPVDFTDERHADPSDPELRPGFRPVAVLFANFVDLSAFLAALRGKGQSGVRAATNILNMYYARMQDVIGRYGGVVNKVDMYTHGDKLMAIFGAPLAYGDDAERAVRAALEMQAVMPEVNQFVQTVLQGVDAPFQPLTQRIGINYGHVFAGNVGSGRKGSRREYTVMGDTVNLASRLMAVADEGDILISPSVQRQVADRFKLEHLPPVRVKGKAEPIAIWRPLRLLTESERTASRQGRAQRPFIGRPTQLRAMQNAALQAVGGAGQVVVVIGEAGTGKTRLVEAFQDHVLQAVPSLSFYATELSSFAQEPYAPIIDLLRGLIGLRGQTAEDVDRMSEWVNIRALGLAHFAPLLGALLALPMPDNPITAALDPEQRHDRLFDLIEAVLRGEARQRPLTLVVDDLQWADESSLELLERLAQAVATVPLLLMLCYRPNVSFAEPWTELAHAQVVRVAEFSPQESGRLVAELLEAPELSDDLMGLVWEKAQGHPFFTEEFVKSLQETGTIVRSNGGWRLAAPGTAGAALTSIPDTIEGIVLARLDRLEARCRDVLQAASVAAMSRARFARPLLERVDPHPVELPARLHSLVNDGLLEAIESELEALEYHFRHTLTRDVAYDTLLYARRRELHGLIAQGIERLYADRLDEYVASLAHHYLEAEMWSQAFHYQRRAGQRAQALFANKDAATYFRRSVYISEKRLPDLLAVVDSAEFVEALTDVHERLGDVLLLEGGYDEALNHYASARAMAEAAEPSPDQVRHLADLCRKSADVHERRSEYDVAFEWLERGLGYLSEDEPTIEAARIYLLGTGVYRRQGKNEEAIAWCQQSLDVASQIETHEGQQAVAQAYYNLGGIYTRQGDLSLAVQFCRQSLEVYERIDDIVRQSQAHINLANVYFEQGNWSLAIEHYTHALEIARKIGDVYHQAFITVNLGGVYLNQGDLDQAADYYRQSMEMWQELGSTYVVALLHNNIGVVALRRGDADEALNLLQKSQELFEQIGSRDFMSEVQRHLAESYLAQDELIPALSCAQRSLTLAQEQEMRLEEGASRRVLGQVHLGRRELDQAEQELSESLRILEELNSRYEIGQTLYQLALLCREQGRRVEAEAVLARALAIFQDLGARHDLAQAQALWQSM